ncbi:MAG: hypothetical protein AB7G87_12430, partial [Clostridia bacterium]
GGGELVISFKELLRLILGILIISAMLTILFIISKNETSSMAMGGSIHPNTHVESTFSKSVFIQDEVNDYSKRFQRPSKQPALNLKYRFRMPKDFDKPPYIAPDYPNVYNSAEDVIHSYYSILKEAANMLEYHGGCGTVGLDKIPYPFAYELLSVSKKQEVSLAEFIKSFSGIGHITLLRLLPAYTPPHTPENIQYYMVEIEVITGPPYKEKENAPGYFAYYYGLITTEHTTSDGWKIKKIDYIPEDFLCAPYHHWHWDAQAITEIIYNGWYGLIDKIEKEEMVDSMIYIYASGKEKEYRLDFIRLTNGYDILLHEYIQEDGQWTEVNLLKEDDQYHKLSILNPMLQKR